MAEVGRPAFVEAQAIAATLEAVAEEMSATVTRTARSPLFNEAHDFTTAIFDFRPQSRPRLVAQAPGCSLHLYAIVGAVEAILERFRFDLHDGDVFLLNDPYAGGTHGPDWTMLRPVFGNGRPVFVAAVRAHMGDNGGPVAGGYNPRAEEIWQEGLRIPPLKLVERGRVREDVLRLLLANNRLPDWLAGDLAAMQGALAGAERRVAGLFHRFGVEGVTAAVDAVIAYAELRTRQALAGWTPGTFFGEATTDHDFQGHRDITVRAAVTVDAGGLTIDLSASDPEAAGFVNSPRVNTLSFVFVAVATVLPGDIPINEGLMRPVTVRTRPGTVVDPLAPAPCGHATAVVGAEVTEAVLRALAPAAPEWVGGNAHKLPLAYSHGRYPDGRPFVNLNFHGYTGGAGAAYGQDGWGLYPPIMAGVILPSVEMTEVQYPCRILRHELWPDSEGAGRWRGAPGVVTDIQYLVPVRTHVMVSGHRHPPQGFLGGQDGAPSRVVIRQGGQEIEVTDVAFDVPMAAGDILHFERGGGGGVGSPRERSPERVAEDVANGIISPGRARDVYGWDGGAGAR